MVKKRGSAEVGSEDVIAIANNTKSTRCVVALPFARGV